MIVDINFLENIKSIPTVVINTNFRRENIQVTEKELEKYPNVKLGGDSALPSAFQNGIIYKKFGIIENERWDNLWSTCPDE